MRTVSNVFISIIILILIFTFGSCNEDDEPIRCGKVVLSVLSDSTIFVKGCHMQDTVVVRDKKTDIAFEKDFIMSEYGWYYEAYCNDPDAFMYCNVYINDKLILHIDGRGRIHTGWFF